jgi:hypothetical protein
MKMILTITIKKLKNLVYLEPFKKSDILILLNQKLFCKIYFELYFFITY